MEGTVEHYMGLPYTVELKPHGKGYRASVKELLGCEVTMKASEGVGELWGRLKEAQRARIEELLELGDDVPEPASADVDPFWEKAADDLDEKEVETMLYRDGVTVFPLRVLVGLWLQELRNAGLSQVDTPGTFPKGGTHGLGQTGEAREGDLRPVRLGKSLKNAWVKFDGPRTGFGYKEIGVLDQPLRAEAAIVAALTVLEASILGDDDFRVLRTALLERVRANSEKLKDQTLQEVLDQLPIHWFSERKADADKELERRLDKELSGLPPDEREKERNKRVPKRWREWERHPDVWRRTIKYMMTLLRYRRPDFEEYTVEQQLGFLDRHRKVIRAFLEGQRNHAAFLEYGTPQRTPRVAELAQNQVKAAVLADVEGLSHREIADRIGAPVSDRSYDLYAKIPTVTREVEAGRTILEDALPDTGWRRYAEHTRAEAARYRSLSEEERVVEAITEVTGWSLEDARALYRTNPWMARFLATPLQS